MSRWWCPDRSFTRHELDLARAFIDQSPVRDRIRAALVTGSPAAGLGHARSDLDLFLVFASEGDQAGFDSMPLDFRGTTVDIRTLTVAELERQRQVVLERESATVIDRKLFGVGNLVAWSVLTRLVSGTVVRATPEVRDLLASLDRNVVRRSVMVLHAIHLGTYVEDAQGALESGDLATALAASQDAVRQAVEVALAAVGDVYIGPKYLQRRMARNPCLAALLDEHGVRMLGHPATSCDDDEVRRLVHWRLWLAGHLTGQSLLTAWDDPVATLPPFGVLADGPIRSPYLMPMRWPGGCGLMTGVNVVHQMSVDDAVLWNLLDGRAFADVSVAFAEHSRQEISDVETRIRRTVDEWRAADIVL
jgi:hypothetical protein